MFPATVEGQRYIFIDTPGFNDSDPARTDIAVFQEILRWFETMSVYCDLAGVLYVYDMMNPRFTASADLNLKMVSALCGAQYFRNVTILTTKWSQVGPGIHTSIVESQEAELVKGPWKDLISGGARVCRHRGLIDAQVIPAELMDMVEAQRKVEQADARSMIRFYRDSPKLTPRIQRELRGGAGVMETQAALVLLRHSGFEVSSDMDNTEVQTMVTLPPKPESITSTVMASQHIIPGGFPDREEPPRRKKNPVDNMPRLLSGPNQGWWKTFCNALYAFLMGK